MNEKNVIRTLKKILASEREYLIKLYRKGDLQEDFLENELETFANITLLIRAIDLNIYKEDIKQLENFDYLMFEEVIGTDDFYEMIDFFQERVDEDEK